MVHGTFTFNKWLGSLEKKAVEMEASQSLSYIALVLKKVFGIQVYFVHVLGTRFHYIAGFVENCPTPPCCCRYSLSDKVWLVSNDLDLLRSDHRNELLAFLKRFISQVEPHVCSEAV